MISADKLLKQVTQPNMHYKKIATYLCIVTDSKISAI